MALINVTDKEREVLTDIAYWLESYIDYFSMDESVEPGEETDAQRFSKMLPILKGLLNKKASKQKTKVVYKEKELKDFNDILALIDSNSNLKGYIDTSVRFARESIRPLYKYLVCDNGLNDVCCWVTNDIGKAMEFGVSRAKERDKMYYVCAILKDCNDTYKAYIEGVCDFDGYNECEDIYYDGTHQKKMREYLHFDYIAQRYGYDNIKAIE